MSNQQINEERCKEFAPNFKASEFKCGCGGKYCNGHPTTLDTGLLKNLQSLRKHYGKPITITSGMRCTTYNQVVGGISNSKHLQGLAADFYIQGKSDTASGRNAIIDYCYDLPNTTYAYGNTTGMGNAVHIDVKDTIEGEIAEIKVDGKWGRATTKALQKKMGTTEDGIISGQLTGSKKYILTNFSTFEFSNNGKGSPCIKALQKYLGVTQDGYFGPTTIKALQKHLGVTQDGYCGEDTTKKLQAWLNR